MVYLNEQTYTLQTYQIGHVFKTPVYKKILEIKSFPGGSNGKQSAFNAGDSGSIPGLGRSPGERIGNPL